MRFVNHCILFFCLHLTHPCSFGVCVWQFSSFLVHYFPPICIHDKRKQQQETNANRAWMHDDRCATKEQQERRNESISGLQSGWQFSEMCQLDVQKDISRAVS